MYRSSRASLLVLAATTAISTAAHANRYVIIDLGGNAHPYTVNVKRNVAGSKKFDEWDAAVWRGDRWHDLGGGYAIGINARGDAVGQSADAPYLWPKGKPGHGVRLPNGGKSGQGNAIARDGAVAGYYVVVVNGENFYHCFITDPENHSVDLGLMGSGKNCFARSINDRRQVVGWGSVTAGGYSQAFMWQDGLFTQLGVLPGGSTSVAYGINKDGDVVGGSTTDGLLREHAVLWRNGTQIDLGTDPKYQSSEAVSINDAGVVVGNARKTSDVDPRAVRFAGGQIIDLADEVDALGDWELSEARSVNNDGVIVGEGSRIRIRDGKEERREHGFMLIPVDSI